MFETFEPRRMFAVTANAFHETLYVWGDNNNNGITIVKDGSDLVAKRYVSGSGYVEFFRKSDSYVKYIRIYGYGGADTITIADTVTDEAEVYGGKGGDYIKGGGGMSRLWGHGDWAGDPSGQHDLATDDGAADILVSGKGYAIHHGQNGDDSFYTDTNLTSGYDVMYGGPGNDLFTVSGHDKTAYAWGESGADTFKAAQNATQKSGFGGGPGWDTATFANWTSAVYVRPDGNAFSGLRYGARRIVLQSDVEFVPGTQQGDYFSGSDTNNTFYGNGGSDIMYGHGGADLLIGHAGNDSIYGGSGNDMLNGSEGDDCLWGGSGNDTVYGDTGQDYIHGDSGNDELYGNEDTDWIYGDDGNDRLIGGSGADYLHSHDGVYENDRIWGNNQDGSGTVGFDVAYIDRKTLLFVTIDDDVSGVESVSY
jgi:hypothetical protein